MKKLFGYIRISDPKQGKGVSLQEQKASIQNYAKRNNQIIIRWFVERKTAAKTGRPVFEQILSLIKNKQADGISIHKIDRSARNMQDWAEIDKLIDQGVEMTR